MPTLEPIELTIDGDLLVESHHGTRNENSVLESWVGNHKGCGNAMHRHHSNDKFDCIVCTGCYLRISFPVSVRTYGELRKCLTVLFNNLRANRGNPWRA